MRRLDSLDKEMRSFDRLFTATFVVILLAVLAILGFGIFVTARLLMFFGVL